MSENIQVGIHFGALSEPLRKQLAEQKLSFDKVLIAYYQKCMDAINVLRISGCMTDKVADKVRQSLHKKIVSHVAKKMKLKAVKK